MRLRLRSWSIIALAALSFAAAARAEDGVAALSDAMAKLAGHRGFRAKIEARDEVAGRSFQATLAYRAPDRLLAKMPSDDFVLLEGGTILLREDGLVRRSDVAGWVRETAKSLGPIYAEAAALAKSTGPAPRFDDLADRLGPLVAIDLRRREQGVLITLLLAHRIELDAARPGLGFTFRIDDEGPLSVIGLDADRVTLRAGPREAVISRRTGFAEEVLLRGPTGRVDAHVIVTEFEALESVPDALVVAPDAGDPAKVEAVDPTPRTKERLAREALAALLPMLKRGAEADALFLARDGPKVEALLGRYYAVLFRAAYPETRLRDEARRAANADHATIEATLTAAATPERRKKALEDLKLRFKSNCTLGLRHVAAELVGLAEGAIGPAAPGAPAEVESARRTLVAMSGRAALAAYKESIVAPMEAQAALELERLAAAPAPAKAASGGNP